MTDETQQETWQDALAEVRDELYTVAFLTEDDLGDWLDNPHDFVSIQDWAMAHADKLQALYKLIPIAAHNDAPAKDRAIAAARELRREVRALAMEMHAVAGHALRFDACRNPYCKKWTALAQLDATVGTEETSRG